jgi:hypothetical protein
VALVEAVVRELGEQLEDLLGLGPLDAARDRPGHEALALLLHLGADLLAHGAPQQVGLAERVAGQHLGDLHHLFLVDDDAEGLGQDRLERRMRIVGRLAAVLARAIGRDVGHRAGAVERDQGDDVREAVGLHVGEGPAHARTFHLEHADGLARRHQGVGLGIVERQSRQVEGDAAPGQELDRLVQHGQGLEAEEVELHEAGRLDPLHVELGDRHVRARIAVERHQLAQRPVADDDARGVGRGVAIEPLEAERDVEHAPHHRIAVARLLETGLVGDRAGQRHRGRRVLRHQLAQLVDLAVGHFEHAPDIAHHPARLQRAEGDDLGDAVLAVAALDIADHLLAAVLAEVDVEIRHRDALGIEEALEQEAVADGIEVGDGERPGDHRAGARAAPRPDRNPLRLRPFDKVRDDQEIARELHLLDHVELEAEAAAIVVLAAAGGEAMVGEPARQPLLGLAAELGGLVGGAAAGLEARQDRRPRQRPHRAAPRDLDGVRGRLRQVGE